MGTVVFPCGCSVSGSMFGGREVLGAHPCATHLFDPAVQEALRALATAIHELHPPTEMDFSENQEVE